MNACCHIDAENAFNKFNREVSLKKHRKTMFALVHLFTQQVQHSCHTVITGLYNLFLPLPFK